MTNLLLTNSITGPSVFNEYTEEMCKYREELQIHGIEKYELMDLLNETDEED